MPSPESTSPEIPARVKKGGMGWGVNVVVDGTVRRFVYKRKKDAQRAKPAHKVGENGRVR